MTIARDILTGRMPDFDDYLRQGESLDDIDEYGFTPLIESVIAKHIAIAEQLLLRGVDINKTDVTGRTPLHWAVDNDDADMVNLLLTHRANANAYTHAGLSILVYPILRRQNTLKHLLYQYGAKLDFSLDFIVAKMIGHRFELPGDVDIVNAQGEFIEVDYEGFILEFTVAMIRDSLRRFVGSFATRHLRPCFQFIYPIIDAFGVADELLQLQRKPHLTAQHETHLIQLMARAPLLILPAASRGHALCFIRYKQWWAKIDRGENSLKEGSINVYHITQPEAFNHHFLQQFLYKKQSRRYFHHTINRQLGLHHKASWPMKSQVTGNCSWANVQAVIPVAYAFLQEEMGMHAFNKATQLYHEWLEWDKDRALDECIQRFYLADKVRKACFASMLAAVLFHACDYHFVHELKRAEKIITILTQTDYRYILNSYLDVYCVRQLTPKGNNLLKLLDDCGVNPNIGVSPVATSLPLRSEDR